MDILCICTALQKQIKTSTVLYPKTKSNISVLSFVIPWSVNVHKRPFATPQDYSQKVLLAEMTEREIGKGNCFRTKKG